MRTKDLDIISRCSLTDKPPQDVGECPRFVAIDVRGFKQYNTLFGYNKATECLGELATFLLGLQKKMELQKEEKMIDFIQKIYRGGDEFVLALSVENMQAEEGLIQELEHSSPLPVAVVRAPTWEAVLNRLAIKSSIKGNSGNLWPLSTRPKDLHHVELVADVLEVHFAAEKNSLSLSLAMTMLWKDPRLENLKPSSSDTFASTEHNQESIWAPRLDVGDWVENADGNKKQWIARTLRNIEWTEKYRLRVDKITEVLWKKESKTTDPDEFRVFRSNDTPLDPNWTKLGPVRREPSNANEKLELPRQADTQDKTREKGFLRIVGFGDGARQHATLQVDRGFFYSSNSFFPFDYVEDRILLGVGAEERDLDLVWWSGDSSKSAWRRLNGFDFYIQKLDTLGRGFSAKNPYLVVRGWRCPGFYQVRVQIPITLLNVMTTAVFWYGAEKVTQKVSIAVTAQLVMASLLLVASSFSKTPNGEMTIIDIQILANMMFLVLITALSLIEWGNCIDFIRPKLKFTLNDETLVEKKCEDSEGLRRFIFCVPAILLLNLIFTFNFWNLATKIRQFLLPGRQKSGYKVGRNIYKAVLCNTREEREKFKGLF